MDPTQITTRPSFTVVGLLYHGDNKHGEIPQLWDELYPDRAAEITGKVNPNVAYGVEDNFDHDTGQWDYVAGYEVTPDAPVPAGMVRKQVPAQTYAVFKTTLPEIGQTMDAIYQTWLPASGYQRGDGPEFEYYDEDFDPAHGKLDFFMYIPVTKP